MSKQDEALKKAREDVTEHINKLSEKERLKEIAATLQPSFILMIQQIEALIQATIENNLSFPDGVSEETLEDIVISCQLIGKEILHSMALATKDPISLEKEIGRLAEQIFKDQIN